MKSVATQYPADVIYLGRDKAGPSFGRVSTIFLLAGGQLIFLLSSTYPI